MKNSSKLVLAASLLSLFAGAVMAAEPDTKWAKEHPRRKEVNARLAHQDQRIKQEVKEGEMSKDQAKELHQQDHAIRQDERAMAAANNGHITRAEQKALNKQENVVSKEIGK